MKKVFITFSVIFLLNCTILNAEQIISTDTDYRIYYPDMPYLLKNVTPFSLGSITDPKILFDLGLLLARKAENANAHACMLGYAQLLDNNYDSLNGHFDHIIAPFFSVDPFKAAQAIEWIANGLTAGGIFPVLSAKYGISDSLIMNLKHRMIFPAILLESFKEDQQRFSEMELAIIDDSGTVNFYPDLLYKLAWSWHEVIEDEETLRRELLISSIIRLKKRFSLEDFEVFHLPLNTKVSDRCVVFAKDPRIIDLTKFDNGYLIHSTEDFILERIRLICSEIYYPRGSKNW